MAQTSKNCTVLITSLLSDMVLIYFRNVISEFIVNCFSIYILLYGDFGTAGYYRSNIAQL